MPDDSLPYQRGHESSQDGADAGLVHAVRDRLLVYNMLLRTPGLTDDGIARAVIEALSAAASEPGPDIVGTLRRARDELSKRNVIETLPTKVRNPSGVLSNAYRVVRPMPDPWTSIRRAQARVQPAPSILEALRYLEGAVARDDQPHPEAATLLAWVQGQFDRGRFPAPAVVATPAPEPEPVTPAPGAPVFDQADLDRLMASLT